MTIITIQVVIVILIVLIEIILIIVIVVIILLTVITVLVIPPFQFRSFCFRCTEQAPSLLTGVLDGLIWRSKNVKKGR